MLLKTSSHKPHSKLSVWFFQLWTSMVRLLSPMKSQFSYLSLPSCMNDISYMLFQTSSCHNFSDNVLFLLVCVFFSCARWVPVGSLLGSHHILQWNIYGPLLFGNKPRGYSVQLKSFSLLKLFSLIVFESLLEVLLTFFSSFKFGFVLVWYSWCWWRLGSVESNLCVLIWSKP